MANREALRELQTRLAARLQQVRSDDMRTAAWLAVECGEQGFLFPLAGAGEIFPASNLVPVPHTQAWFAGVANLRGGLHGVVDLAVFLGLADHAAVRESSLLVALNASLASHSALLVQRLAGLRHVDQMQPELDEPGTPAKPAFAGGRWRDAQGRVWQEIDLAALARFGDYLSIGAGTGAAMAAATVAS
jgi:twitching motility protein PilI